MKINATAAGNYNPFQIKNVAPKPKIDFVKELKETDPVINGDEKNFFTKLYPDNKNEIIDYHFYQKSGKMSGVALGTNLDRRG